MNTTIGTEPQNGQRICYANRHMLPAEFGMYDLCKTISHGNSGIMTYSYQSLAELFGKCSDSTAGRYVKILVNSGWLELVHGKEYNGNGTSTPNHYRVLEHKEWAKLHPGSCCSDAKVANNSNPPVKHPDPPVGEAHSPVNGDQPARELPPPADESGSTRPWVDGNPPAKHIVPSLTHSVTYIEIPLLVQPLTQSLIKHPVLVDSSGISLLLEPSELSVSSTRTQEDFKDGNEEHDSNMKETSHIKRVEANVKQEARPPSSVPAQPVSQVAVTALAPATWPPVRLRPRSDEESDLLDELANMGMYLDEDGNTRESDTHAIVPLWERKKRVRFYKEHRKPARRLQDLDPSEFESESVGMYE